MQVLREKPTMADEKSSFFGSLKRLVVEDEAPKVTPQNVAPTGPANVTQPVGQLQTFGQPSVNPDMVTTLQKVIDNRKTPYTALLEAADKLKTVITDDTTRLKAGFAMVVGDGQRSLPSIMQAIDLHQTDLDGELMRFKASTATALTQKVGGLRSQAESLQRTREGTLANIAILEKQIADQRQSVLANENEIQELTNQAANAEAEINSVASQFESAVAAVKADLNNKKTQLSSVLTS